MSTQRNDDWGFWLIVVASAGLAVIAQTILGGNSSSAPPAPPGVDRGSFEHKYATERLKQEGYSQAESQQAADAILKFHNAQQNRSK